METQTQSTLFVSEAAALAATVRLAYTAYPHTRILARAMYICIHTYIYMYMYILTPIGTLKGILEDYLKGTH